MNSFLDLERRKRNDGSGGRYLLDCSAARSAPYKLDRTDEKREHAVRQGSAQTRISFFETISTKWFPPSQNGRLHSFWCSITYSFNYYLYLSYNNKLI
jgi:hypothetical protein